MTTNNTSYTENSLDKIYWLLDHKVKNIEPNSEDYLDRVNAVFLSHRDRILSLSISQREQLFSSLFLTTNLTRLSYLRDVNKLLPSVCLLKQAIEMKSFLDKGEFHQTFYPENPAIHEYLKPLLENSINQKKQLAEEDQRVDRRTNFLGEFAQFAPADLLRDIRPDHLVYLDVMGTISQGYKTGAFFRHFLKAAIF